MQVDLPMALDHQKAQQAASRRLQICIRMQQDSQQFSGG
jgi:hypothetical protein